jgi:hypothetical protein
MNLSPIKRQILQALLLHKNRERQHKSPKKQANQSSENKCTHGQSAWATRCRPQKDNTSFPSEGKKALDFTAITQEKPKQIGESRPEGQRFPFYVAFATFECGRNNFEEFCQKTSEVSVESCSFIWIGEILKIGRSLGDNETAKEIASLKPQKLAEENLRAELKATIEKRYRELKEAAGQNVPSSS